MPASHIKIINNPENLVAPFTITAPDSLISGDPNTKTDISFKSTDTTILSGIWESAAFCKMKSHPDEMEFCYLIEGQVKITDKSGNFSEFNSGDAFIVEPGFDGYWESKSTVRKYFVLAKCQ